MEDTVKQLREQIKKDLAKEQILKLKRYIKKFWKEGIAKRLATEEVWPKTIIYDNEDVPFLKAELHKDGTVTVWPRQPLKYVSLTLTCPKDIKFEDFKEIVEDSVKELGESNE